MARGWQVRLVSFHRLGDWHVLSQRFYRPNDYRVRLDVLWRIAGGGGTVLCLHYAHDNLLTGCNSDVPRNKEPLTMDNSFWQAIIGDLVWRAMLWGGLFIGVPLLLTGLAIGWFIWG